MAQAKYWLDGAPWLGANSGIDPGQTKYWTNGAPLLDVYQATSSFAWKSINGTAVASVKSVGTVLKASIQSIINV